MTARVFDYTGASPRRTSTLLRAACFLLVAASVVAAFACDDDDPAVVEIVQRDGDCQPGAIAAAPGARLKLEVQNESSRDGYVVVAREGARLDEDLSLAPGDEASTTLRLDDGVASATIVCAAPGGPSTIIEISTGSASATGPAAVTPIATNPASPTANDTPPSGPEAPAIIGVTLGDFTITPAQSSVAAGRVRFVATNTSGANVHELAVLQVDPQGALVRRDAAAAIPPGEAGSVTLDLTPGAYQLACQIKPGESGSTVDHYLQGMHVDFTVE
jgi:uncharacterized cupredoxin-like copper-binding protein